MNIIVGLILVTCGVLLLRYRYQVYNFTGDWDWAQRVLGSQGTLTVISLTGALLIGIGSAYALGAFEKDPNTPSTVNIFPTQQY